MTADARYRPVPLVFERLSRDEQVARARAFLAQVRTRRTVRHYSAEPVPDEVIDCAIAAAASAPSGANLQPWRFVVVRDPAVKRRIREAAEEEERESYEHRMPDEWLDALAPLGTDWRKPYLLIPVGYPSEGAEVPDITKKPMGEVRVDL